MQQQNIHLLLKLWLTSLLVTLLSCSNSPPPAADVQEIPQEYRWGIYSLDLSSQVVELIYSSPNTISKLRLNHAGDRFALSQLTNNDDQNSAEIFTVSVTGGDNPTNPKYLYGVYPTWSADDSQIAFLSMRDGDMDIFAFNADGSEEYKLYDSGSHDADINWVGDRIVFTSESSIWIMAADGRNPNRPTQPPRVREWGNANLPFGDYDPNLNPNVSMIVFERMVADTSPHGNYELFTINADGSGENQLTDNRNTQGLPIWSHSGEQIVFLVSILDEQGVYDIHMVNADGSDYRNVTPAYFPAEFLCQAPIFSLNDGQIYFVGEWYE